jgi:hypothetical protein
LVNCRGEYFFCSLTVCPYELCVLQLTTLGFFRDRVSLLALIAHLRLTVPSTRRFGARSKRAQLTSPVLTAVDRAPCSPTPSGAFIAVTSSTAHLARTPGAPFSPPSLLRTCREAMGASPAPRGARLVGFERPELTRRDPHVSPKHPQERPERLTIGRERPMDGARRAPRCAPLANFSPRRPTPRLSRTHPFSHTLAESHRFPGVALPSPASDIAAFPAFAQGNMFRGMRPRATAALTPSASRRPTPVRPTAPAFSPFESPNLTVEARSAADVSARGAPRAGRCRGVCVHPGGVADALTRDMDTPAPRPSGEPARRRP